IPCKHVFCLTCARADNTHCPRCREKVLRVEQTGLGTVFMCTHSGTRYGNTGCRRTYLSQRDLQAHINHRHVGDKSDPEPSPHPALAVVKPLPAVVGGGSSADPRHPQHAHERRPRTNLITVPIHEDSHSYYNYYQSQPVPPPAMPTVGSVGNVGPPVSNVGVGLGGVMSVPPPYYAAPYAPQTAPPATYVGGAPMTTNVAGVSPMPAMSTDNRWPEGYPPVQWPNTHHYYR
ncbi:hypothetical protein KGM_205847B, partial [Danaus plexippus plexippus]